MKKKKIKIFKVRPNNTYHTIGIILISLLHYYFMLKLG